MKSIRIWLLLLLAVLLPVRGAMAAAMLCPPAGFGSQAEVVISGHLGHESMSAVGHGGDHQHSHHTDAASGGNTGDGGTSTSTVSDSCNLCSAFCSATPLLSSAPAVAAPQNLSAAVFPRLSAPAPSFLSDGQERPPRSI